MYGYHGSAGSVDVDEYDIVAKGLCYCNFVCCVVLPCVHMRAHHKMTVTLIAFE